MRSIINNSERLQSPEFFYGYIIVLITFLISVVAEGVLYTFGVFFEPILSDFGWSRAVTSAASSIGIGLELPIAIIAGRLTDKFGPRVVLTICGLSWGFGFLLLSRAETVWQLYLFYGLGVGLGMGLYWSPVISLIPRWFVKRRALMMGIVTSGIGVGQLIFPPLANWLIVTYGWRNSFIIIGSIALIIIVISAQFLKNMPGSTLPDGDNQVKQENSEDSVIKTTGFTLTEAMHTRQFWMFEVMFFSWFFSLAVAMVHSVIHAIGIGMSVTSSAFILSIIGITGIFSRLVFGRLADVTGLKPVVMISYILMTLCFLWLLVAGEPWMLYLFAAVYGIAYGVVETLQSTILADLFGVKFLGTISGMSTAIGGIGWIVGPALAGYIFDVRGSYQIAFLICAVLEFVGLVLCAFLPLSRVKKEPSLA